LLIQENFRRATAEIVVLHLLMEEDLYGYQLVKRIQENSDNLYSIPEGTLYPVMYRMISKGLVSEFNRMVNKRLRRYYHLEDSGRAYYVEALQEYQSMTRGILRILEGKGGNDQNDQSIVTES